MPRHICYTMVALTYPHGAEKGIGGLVFASIATARAGIGHLPPSAPQVSIREIELPGPLAQYSTRHPDYPGGFQLTQAFPIGLSIDRAGPQKHAKPKKKAKKAPPISLFDTT